jgi:hypothetical protein
MSDASWLPGFTTAVGTYLVDRHTVSGGSIFAMPVISPLALHFKECALVKTEDVEQTSEDVSVFDTFDPDRTYPTSFLGAKVTCKCGEYTKASVSVQGEIQDIIYGVIEASRA